MKIYVFLILIYVAFMLTLLIGQESGGSPHGDIKLECSICHSTESWQVNPKTFQFNHDQTGYPLIGKHESVICKNCHQRLIFSHIGVRCIDCHIDIHKGELGFNCENCHSARTWENRQEIFERHSETRFPLMGSHAVVDCEACHFNQEPSEYKTTPLICAGCHLENYNATSNPNHVNAGFSTECETCHPLSAPSWYQVVYTHPANFVLRGAHLQTECNDCHVAGYPGTPNQCEDCHMQEYNDAVDPDHSTFGFPTDCALCHNEYRWESTTFDHLADAGFELRGAHLTIQCVSCHVNNQVTGLPRTCIGCHEEDYNSVEDPDHVAGQFSHDCLDCHTELVWSPSTFDHNSTGFILTGAHLTVACGDCHVNGQYQGLPSDCFSCHEDDYNSTSNPNHVAASIPTQCETCHSTTGWEPATFDHNNTDFPLTGAHLATACNDCHINGQYDGLPTDCFSCHEDDYNNTSDPNHIAAAFPVQCETCHNTTNWDQTTWDHDTQYFPIYTGAHQDEWATCDECHTIPADYKLFECIFCHPHSDKTETDNKHREESGYEYLSSECYRCHKDGQANDD